MNSIKIIKTNKDIDKIIKEIKIKSKINGGTKCTKAIRKEQEAQT